MSKARQERRHPGIAEKRLNLFKKAFKKVADKNLERYNLKVQEVIELYHHLCLEWEDKGIDNYKNAVFFACNARWLKYCSHNRFFHPKPKKEYFEELIKQVI
ncbi:MAG: hypothetical protein ACOYOV_05185 [Bacteroidales bacterium]